MKNGLCCILFTVLAFFSSAAQIAPQSAVYKPEDIVRIVVQFEKPVKLSGGFLSFNLEGEPHPNQRHLGGSIGGFGAGVEALSDTKWIISDKIGPDVATGTYKLVQIRAISGGVSRVYNADKDFKGTISIRVVNPAHSLPDIKDVAPAPPK